MLWGHNSALLLPPMCRGTWYIWPKNKFSALCHNIVPLVKIKEEMQKNKVSSSWSCLLYMFIVSGFLAQPRLHVMPVTCLNSHSSWHALFCSLCPGLPLVVALLPDQRLHGSLSVCLRCALLLLEAANSWSCQHHPLLWIHYDYGPYLLPLHRWGFEIKCRELFKQPQWFPVVCDALQFDRDIMESFLCSVCIQRNSCLPNQRVCSTTWFPSITTVCV